MERARADLHAVKGCHEVRVAELSTSVGAGPGLVPGMGPRLQAFRSRRCNAISCEEGVQGIRHTRVSL